MLTFKPDIYIYSRWGDLFISRPTDSEDSHLQADVSTSVIFIKVCFPTKLPKTFSQGEEKKKKKEKKRKGESRKQNGNSSKKSDPTNLKYFSFSN